MPTIFHHIPRDAETVAELRRLCAERGFPADCETPCRRAGRCRGAWRDAHYGLVLPPCLEARCDAAYDRLAEAEVELTALRLIVAEARKLPNPAYAAEFADFDEDGAEADAAPWE